MFVVSLSLLNFCELYNFGAHPLAMDAHSGNARGGIQMRLTHPPVRAHILLPLDFNNLFYKINNHFIIHTLSAIIRIIF